MPTLWSFDLGVLPNEKSYSLYCGFPQKPNHWPCVFQKCMFDIQDVLIPGKAGKVICGRQGLAPAYLMRII